MKLLNSHHELGDEIVNLPVLIVCAFVVICIVADDVVGTVDDAKVVARSVIVVLISGNVAAVVIGSIWLSLSVSKWIEFSFKK